MMIKHDDSDHEKENGERWLLTYSDMITLLLVLFIVMYTMSTVDAKKFETISKQLGSVLGDGKRIAIVDSNNSDNETASEISSGLSSEEQANPEPANFDEIYKRIKEYINSNNLQNDITVENDNSYILLRFKDNVLFYPDSAVMFNSALPLLKDICNSLNIVSDKIEHIKIDGHTAYVGNDNSIGAWRLSSERAITVLNYLSIEGKLQQSKMSVEAFAHYKPIGDNSTPEGMSMNRRVEIMITKIPDIENIK